jgi:uncharacterized Fe-S cluster protein YjdI
MMREDFVARLSCTEWKRTVRGEAFLFERRNKFWIGADQTDADPNEIMQEPGMIS